MQLSIVIFYILSNVIFIPIVIESRSILISHKNPSNVKHFESKLDTKIGYWSPSTSSIDWCERNYVITKYIAEFWNCMSSFVMCILAGILIIRGLYNRIEKRFLLLSLSFGLVGFGSAYFHGTLTHVGQMADELPMVYSMIIWWFILYRMDKFKKLNNKLFLFDILILFGIFYGVLCTYIHSLKTFVIIFQLHFTLMVLGGIIKLIYLYQKMQYHINSIMYLIMAYVGLLIPAIICWIIDQQLCERMNDIGGFNPQLHAWWHIICAIDCHVGIVCGEAMRFLSIKYQEYQVKSTKSSQESFKSKDHLRIVFYFGLPFVDYSKDKQINEIKNQ
jgi:dihydroceramidase